MNKVNFLIISSIFWSVSVFAHPQNEVGFTPMAGNVGSTNVSCADTKDFTLYIAYTDITVAPFGVYFNNSSSIEYKDWLYEIYPSGNEKFEVYADNGIITYSYYALPTGVADTYSYNLTNTDYEIGKVAYTLSGDQIASASISMTNPSISELSGYTFSIDVTNTGTEYGTITTINCNKS